MNGVGFEILARTPVPKLPPDVDIYNILIALFKPIVAGRPIKG